MKKLLLLLLAFPLFFAACSSDDEEGGDEFATITLTGKATAHNRIELEWSKVSGAHSYQVFYKAEGNSEWERSNIVMPNDDQSATVLWDGNLFSENVKYTFMVKAFRDSREDSVIGKSNELEITTPEYITIVGGWQSTRTYSAKLVSNLSDEDNARIEEFIVGDYKSGDDDNLDVLYFDAIGKYDVYQDVFNMDDETPNIKLASGTYTFVNDVLEVTYKKTGDDEERFVSVGVALTANTMKMCLDVKADLKDEGSRGYDIKEILGDKYDDFEIESAVFIQEYTRVE